MKRFIGGRQLTTLQAKAKARPKPRLKSANGSLKARGQCPQAGRVVSQVVSGLAQGGVASLSGACTIQAGTFRAEVATSQAAACLIR
ncbi:MAG: hypothetical protein KDG57_01375 [Rhodoferax sp.]|nr:hypothetical protein [Rhodoferax sp.]